MNTEEKMSTIRVDLLEVYHRIKRAQDMLSTSEQPEIWNELDRAIARLEGMAPILGPWEAELTGGTPK